MSAPGVPRRFESVADAVEELRAGGLVAFPTETVWGIAADARQPAAVKRLYAFKGRDPEQPVSILVAGVEALAALDVKLDAAGRRLAAAFWPGPLTLVLPCAASFAPGIVGADGAVGFRCSPHPVAAALVTVAAAAGLGPLTATSLNRAGAPAAADLDEAEAVCAAPDAPALLAVGADAGGAVPSSVVALGRGAPTILREGAIARTLLLEVIQEPRSA